MRNTPLKRMRGDERYARCPGVSLQRVEESPAAVICSEDATSLRPATLQEHGVGAPLAAPNIHGRSKQRPYGSEKQEQSQWKKQ